MKDLLYLTIYLLTGSTAFSGMVVCVFARRRGGPGWLSAYAWWLVSATCFLMVRNIGFFVARFAGYRGFENGLLFFVIYIVTSGLFTLSLTWILLRLMVPSRVRLRILLASITGGLPLLVLPFLAILGKFPGNPADRLSLISLVMYYTCAVVAGVNIFILVRINKPVERDSRPLLIAGFLAGLLYLVLAVIKWFVVYDHRYTVETFSMVNIGMMFLFVSVTAIVGCRYLKQTDLPASEPDTIGYPELSDSENRILSRIGQGATNQEIADDLKISVSSVKNTLFRLYSRFGVNSRTELLLVFEKKDKTGAVDPRSNP